MSVWEQFTEYLAGGNESAAARSGAYENVMSQARAMNAKRMRLPDTSNPADMLTLALMSIGAGPKPGALGAAARMDAANPSITGGHWSHPDSASSLFYRQPVTRARDVREAVGADYTTVFPPRPANNNFRGPVEVQTKGGDAPRLLSAGVPIWAGVRSQLNAEPSTETDANAGRFAEPRISNPDAEIAEDTRAMRRRVSSAADELEALTSRNQDRVPSAWDQFERAR